MTSEKLQLSLGLMGHAATKWAEASSHLSPAAAKISKVQISEEQAGTFAPAIATYSPVPEYVRARLAEGMVVTTDIADVLIYARNTYEAEDVSLQQALQQQQGEI